MKLFLTASLYLFCFSLISQQSSSDFVTTWRTYNDGLTGDSSVQIKTVAALNYNYDIDWNNDGQFDNFGVQGDIVHTYPDTGTYTIRIKGLFPGINFGTNTLQLDRDFKKIVSVDQWGDQVWLSLYDAFKNCENNRVLAVDTPNLSQVQSLAYMFFFNSHFNTPVNSWDVSNVRDFNGLFWGTSFNQELDQWNVSQATNMRRMFSNTPFNRDIGNWTTANVQNMSGMFYLTPFNFNINSWNVAQVQNFSDFLAYNNFFNQPLNLWNVSSAQNMKAMFRSANEFNQNLNSWNVNNVRDMTDMFDYALKFNGNLSSWDVDSVQDFKGMFKGAKLFNQDISSWNTISAQDMSFMFDQAEKFNQDISNWNMQNVTNITAMFQRAYVFNQPIGKWNTASLTNMNGAFFFASAFDQNIGTWDIADVNSPSPTFFLNNSGMSSANYDSLLMGWAAQPHQNNLSFNMTGLEYCQGEAARTSLMADGWNLIGDAKLSGCVISSVEESEKKLAYVFYPNPAKEFIYIEKQETVKNQELLIYTLDSKLLKRVSISGSKQQISLEDLPSGMYFIQLGGVVKQLIIH